MACCVLRSPSVMMGRTRGHRGACRGSFEEELRMSETNWKWPGDRLTDRIIELAKEFGMCRCARPEPKSDYINLCLGELTAAQIHKRCGHDSGRALVVGNAGARCQCAGPLKEIELSELSGLPPANVQWLKGTGNFPELARARAYFIDDKVKDEWDTVRDKPQASSRAWKQIECLLRCAIQRTKARLTNSCQ